MNGLPSDPGALGRLTRDEYEIGRVEGEIFAIDDDIRLEERFGRRPPERWLERREILVDYLETLRA